MFLRFLFGRKVRASSRTSRIKSDYAYRGGDANPERASSRETRRLAWGTIVISLLIIGMLSVWYWIFFSGYFKVRNIKIQGAPPEQTGTVTDFTRAQLQKRAWLFFSREQSLFLVRKNEIAEAIAATFPVTSVKVNPILPDTLSISILPRLPRYIAGNPNDSTSYLIDEEGVVIAHTPPPPENALWHLQVVSVRKIGVNEPLLEKSIIDFINELHDLATTSIHRYRIVSLDLTRIPIGDVIAQTDKGWQIYFTKNELVQVQVANVERALQEIQQAKKSIRYVDVRIPTRIFYQ